MQNSKLTKQIIDTYKHRNPKQTLIRNKGNSILELPDDYVLVDLETTGYDPSYSDIIEFAALRVRENLVIDTLSSLVNPGNEIEDYITELTGITNEIVQSAPSLTEIIGALQTFIGDDILVAHNANFDINFLYDNFKKYLNLELNNDFVDTLRISRRAFPSYPKHSLSFLRQHIPIANSEEHRALADCEATYQIYNICKKKILEDNIPLRAKQKRLPQKEIAPNNNGAFDECSPLYASECVFTGTLSRMTRTEAMQCVADIGGINGKTVTKQTKYLIMGIQDFEKFADGKESSKTKKAKDLASKGQNIHIISEDDFYLIIFDLEK